MAGFLTKALNSFKQNNVTDFLKELSSLGLKNSDILKNSRAVGYTYNMLSGGLPYLGGEDDYAMFLALSIPDTNLRKNISFFDKSYTQKREQLRQIAMQDEIEDILNTIADETVIYDANHYFCKAKTITIPLQNRDEIEKTLQSNFKKIYRYFNFSDDNTAWSLLYKFLVDGYLAFEIIYDNEQKNIIGFKELDSITLEPSMDKDTKKMIWYQFKDQASKERMLYDSQIIYISYSTINTPSRVSYVERLVRAFNVLRIMEQTRLIWAVVNSSFKTKFLIPIGEKSKNRARQSLQSLAQRYNEDVQFDDSSGTISIQGKPNLPFMKQFWFPVREGESPEIDVIGNNGPDLSDVEALNYFYDKLKLVSKIPFSRFEKREGGGNVDFTGESLSRDEVKFGRFVDRIRSIFCEIIEKPLWIQMCLDFPDLADDVEFESQICIEFNKDNYYEEIKNIEMTQKRLDIVNNMMSVMSPDGSTPFFNAEVLMSKYLKMDKDFLETNSELQKKQKEEIAKAEAGAAKAGGGGGW